MRSPNTRLTLDGKEITPIKERLIGLTLIDKRGLEADQLDLTLSDHDGQLNLPRRGVSIHCHLGWQGDPLVDKGTFTVDEVQHSGSPDKLIVSARSADFRQGFLEQRECSWHQKTLSEIVETIAANYQLKTTIAEPLQQIAIDHIDQTHESDAHLLSRLATTYNAITTVKNNRLLVLPIGQAKTVSGLQLQPITLSRQQGDRHRYHEADHQGRYTGIKAHWVDKTMAQMQTVIIGTEGYLKTLRSPYANQAEASAAAEAAWQRLQRSQQSLDITLAEGRPEIIPETPVTLSHWKPAINTISWLTREVRHSINDTGFTSQLSLEAHNN